MKQTLGIAAIAIALCFVAFQSNRNATADNATTEPENARQHDDARAGDTPTGRFQISAFTNGTGGTGFGYYVIDSTTGEFWMGYGDEKPSKVSEPLLK